MVDIDKKWKLHGMDAELYIRANRTLLSLMINVAQGEFQDEFEDRGQGLPKVDPRQAVLDANFETFLAHTLRGIPSGILTGWSTDEAALAAHAIHGAPGFFNWADWSAQSAHTVTDIGDRVLKKAGPAWFNAIVPEKWRQRVLDRQQKQKAETK